MTEPAPVYPALPAVALFDFILQNHPQNVYWVETRVEISKGEFNPFTQEVATKDIATYHNPLRQRVAMVECDIDVFYLGYGDDDQCHMIPDDEWLQEETPSGAPSIRLLPYLGGQSYVSQIEYQLRRLGQHQSLHTSAAPSATGFVVEDEGDPDDLQPWVRLACDAGTLYAEVHELLNALLEVEADGDLDEVLADVTTHKPPRKPK